MAVWLLVSQPLVDAVQVKVVFVLVIVAKAAHLAEEHLLGVAAIIDRPEVAQVSRARICYTMLRKFIDAMRREWRC